MREVISSGSGPVHSLGKQVAGVGPFHTSDGRHSAALVHPDGGPNAASRGEESPDQLVHSFSGTSHAAGEAGRRRVARILTAFSSYSSTAAPGRFDNLEFEHGTANNFPEIPGESKPQPFTDTGPGALQHPPGGTWTHL